MDQPKISKWPLPKKLKTKLHTYMWIIQSNSNDSEKNANFVDKIVNFKVQKKILQREAKLLYEDGKMEKEFHQNFQDILEVNDGIQEIKKNHQRSKPLKNVISPQVCYESRYNENQKSYHDGSSSIQNQILY